MSVKTSKNNVKCRLAPSPTGNLHLGNLFVFYVNYIFVTQNRGELIFRVDDTDTKRNSVSNREFITSTKSLLNTFGIDFSNTVLEQSKNKLQYMDIIRILVEHNIAYNKTEDDKVFIFLNVHNAVRFISSNFEPNALCQSLEYNSNRLKMIWSDVIKGQMTTDIELNDFVLYRITEDSPTYHFASTVDDFLNGITHVIRAEDWVPSTPKHIVLLLILQRILKDRASTQLLVFGHVPLLRDPRGKLSKRDHSITLNYMLQTFHPLAILNYLMTASVKNMPDFISNSFLLKNFSLDRIRKTSPLIDLKKLEWVNQRYVKFFTNVLHVKNTAKQHVLKFLENNIQYPRELKYVICMLIDEFELDTMLFRSILSSNSYETVVKRFLTLFSLYYTYVQNTKRFVEYVCIQLNSMFYTLIHEFYTSMIEHFAFSNEQLKLHMSDLKRFCSNEIDTLDPEQIHSIRSIVFGEKNGIPVSEFKLLPNELIEAL